MSELCDSCSMGEYGFCRQLYECNLKSWKKYYNWMTPTGNGSLYYDQDCDGWSVEPIPSEVIPEPIPVQVSCFLAPPKTEIIVSLTGEFPRKLCL
jgi:hypothetical protein